MTYATWIMSVATVIMTIATIVMAWTERESNRLNKSIIRVQEEERERRNSAAKAGLESMLSLAEELFKRIEDGPETITSGLNNVLPTMPDLGYIVATFEGDGDGKKIPAFRKAIYDCHVTLPGILDTIERSRNSTQEGFEQVKSPAKIVLKSIQEAQQICGFRTLEQLRQEQLTQ